MYLVGQDLRYGARLLTKAPGFTLVALLALALGTGATTSIFSVVDAVLLKPLPYRDPGRLLVIYEKNPAQKKYKLLVSPTNFLEWQQASRGMERMAAVHHAIHINLTGGPNGHLEPEELRLERVTADLFPLLGVQAALGRVFGPDEDKPGRANFVLLSDALWKRRFGGDPAIASKAIRLRDQSYTVLGVMPKGFQIVDPNVDVWIPLAVNASDARIGASRFLVVMARLKPGATPEQAKAELESIGNRLEQANPALNKGWRPSVFTLEDERVGEVRQPLVVLAGAVGLLLLMACVNVANLLLARGGGRRRELAIRTALGATRGRVVAQLISESMLLALAGGALGVALARGAMALVRWLGPASIPRLAEAHLDGRVLLFALAVSIVTGVLFGVAPALQVAGRSLNGALIDGGRGGTMGRKARLLRSGLVVSEVALAVVVTIGAGLLIRSFVRLRAADPGFRPAGVLTFRLPLAGGRNTASERRVAFVGQVTERLASLPGVQSIGGVNSLPLTGFGLGAMFWAADRPAPAPDQRPMALTRAATIGYFQTLGIPLLAGRLFTDADTRQAPPVVAVSQTLARRLWPGENAIGRKLAMEDAINLKTAEVIGIVGDAKQERIEGEDWPTIYSPYAQVAAVTMVVALRTAGDPLAIRHAVESEIRRLDPDQPVADVRPMQDIADEAVAGARFNTVLLSIFAGIAFVLAAVGIYGVISYDVTERLHEFGIRMALGAQAEDVQRLVMGQAARLTAGGIALGVAGALVLTRFMANMLYGVKPTDANTFLLMAALLGAVALAASYLPSRRATRVDPAVALRHE
jgi:putative ABC transport system permease protein